MTPTQPPPPAAKPAALPLVALILGVVGFCLPPLFLVAIVLAIVSLVKSSEPAYGARKVLAIITLVLGLVYVPVIGILAAIAIPNFIKFQARAKQTECKMNLQTAVSLQEVLFLNEEYYSTSPSQVGFDPGPSSRYLYRFQGVQPLEEVGVAPRGAGAASVTELEAGIPKEVRELIGKAGGCPDDCAITMLCAGNIDNDATLDIWSISTMDRTVNGVHVPARTAFNHVDDTRE